jgi:predicted proteasome-type protease
MGVHMVIFNKALLIFLILSICFFVLGGKEKENKPEIYRVYDIGNIVVIKFQLI